MLSAVETIKKTGKESFLLNGEKLPFDVLSFWQWSSSELLGNALRGVLAEFIIASALGITEKPREEWDAYDLITPTGLKVEVKSSSYLQSWGQTNLSKIIFGIQPTEDILENNGDKIRRSDIYIFCVLSHQDKDTVDPLNLSQWDFYILNTSVLNERVKEQKTITLSSLLRLNLGIPTQAGHPYRLMPATHTDASRPPIPTQAGHPVSRRLCSPAGQ